MMINHSLKVLTDDIKGILRNSGVITDKMKNYLPIYFDKDVSSSCRDKYVKDEVFEVFNTSNVIYNPKGIVMTTIRDKFNVNLNNLNFVVINIINVSDSVGVETKDKPKKVTNNPPTPPYINLTNLIYNLPISKGGMQTDFNSQTIKKEYYEIRNRLKEFNFYQNSVIFTDDIMKFKMDDESNEENILSAVKKLLDLVKGNNPSTLIGSMETLEMLQSNIKFLCGDNKKVDYDKVTFSGVSLMTDKFQTIKGEDI
jgi:hypothetical protein